MEISPGSLYKRGAGYDRIEMIFVQNLYGPAESGKYFAGKTKELTDYGMDIVGGCCGTNPDFIAALRDALRKKNKESVENG